MESAAWTISILHEIGIIIAASAGVIAAVSSLKNGRTLNGQVKKKVEAVHAAIVKPKPKKTPSEESKDWYSPPDFDK